MSPVTREPAAPPARISDEHLRELLQAALTPFAAWLQGPLVGVSELWVAASRTTPPIELNGRKGTAKIVCYDNDGDPFELIAYVQARLIPDDDHDRALLCVIRIRCKLILPQHGTDIAFMPLPGQLSSEKPLEPSTIRREFATMNP